MASQLSPHIQVLQNKLYRQTPHVHTCILLYMHVHVYTCKIQVVKAGENEWTTFDVVFLPRVPGPVQDTLYIHTSHGTFDFKVWPLNHNHSGHL